MSDAGTIASAIIIALHDHSHGRIARLLDLLVEASISVELVPTPDEAAARVLLTDRQVCVLIDATAIEAGGESEIIETIEALESTIPQLGALVIGNAPPARFVVECIRGGAADFIDISEESEAGMLQAIDRYGALVQSRQRQRSRMMELRTIVEEFLKDLVKTERRSIDLEHQLAAKDRRPGHSTVSALDSDREPAILVLEDDREVADMLVEELEGAGLVTYAFVTGEDAVLEITNMTRRGEAIDLAIVDANLPGIDGLEAIRRMRDAAPGLAAILMTGYSTQETAVNAADLGVVGYVLKPFDDVGGLIARIKEQAVANRDLARERHYLAQIKERHDGVLTRYRKLAALLDGD